jgi:hypothetical protein
MMTQLPAQPDPRVLAMISRALDHSIYSPATQLAIVQCFSAVFGATEWWGAMLEDDPEIAAIVRIANTRTMH